MTEVLHACSLAPVPGPPLPCGAQAQPCVLFCDRLFFPVHVGVAHWAAACIDLQRRRLHYWDSMNQVRAAGERGGT